MTDTCVRYLLGNRAGNSLTYCVRNPFVLYFTLISSAADFSSDRLGTPGTSANGCAGTLNLHCFAASGFVDGAAGAAIVFPGTRLADTFFNNRTGAMFGCCFPFTTADFNIVPGMNGLTNSTTYITITGFVVRFVDRAADIPIVGFTNRTSNGVTNIPVTRIVDRLADRVANILVAGVIDRSSTLAGDSAITGLVNGTTNFIADVSITGLVNGLANRIALISVARLIHILCVLDGNLFANRIMHYFFACITLLFPNGFYDSFVTGT